LPPLYWPFLLLTLLACLCLTQIIKAWLLRGKWLSWSTFRRLRNAPFEQIRIATVHALAEDESIVTT
jgi:hypothetical protein